MVTEGKYNNQSELYINLSCSEQKCLSSLPDFEDSLGLIFKKWAPTQVHNMYVCPKYGFLRSMLILTEHD